MDLLTSIFEPGGPIASLLGDGYEPRPEQTQMARAAARAMEQRSHLLAEAGTGVGKSFAYLVPAILRCVLAGERVVIATNTIALQEQLVSKDIPLLRQALESHEPGEGSPIPPSLRGDVASKLFPVLVKGRGNYVSIRRLKQASQRQDKLFADAAARRTLHVIEDWAYATTDGTLSTLPPLERPGVWDKVQSDSGNCMGRKCPTYEQCFYQKARREMERGNLLVCNHALFFSDLALRAGGVGFLPDYQHVVLDEAHAAEDVAAEHFGVSLSEGRVIHLLTTLYHAKTGKGYLPQLQLIAGDAQLADGLIRECLRAENACRGFFDELLRWRRGASGSSAAGRVRAAGIIENTLSPAMEQLAVKLRGAKDAIKNEPDRFELNAYAERASDIATAAKVLIDQSQPGCAYWIEVSGEEDDGPRRSPRITLACAPVEVAPLLKEHLFGAEVSVVLTSATLATGGKPGQDAGSPAEVFHHAMGRLGCDGAAGLRLGSPFEYASQVELHVERSMPAPDRGGARGGPARSSFPPRGSSGPSDADLDQRDPWERASRPIPGALNSGGSYNEILASRILHHLDASDGGAFVLFTSFATLDAVAALLEGELQERGMPLLVQGKSGPRGLLVEKFRQDDRSVLLGAASFWQGVDVRGRGLRNVIITRLPFEPPDRPLTEARLELITARGGDPFRDDSLPRAIIKFKQGFGRLIRSKTDKGRVVVLDPRIVTTGYGRRFIDALPAGVKVVMG